MKKLITILSLIIVVLVGLIGCSNKTVETSETKQKDIGTFSKEYEEKFKGKYDEDMLEVSLKNKDDNNVEITFKLRTLALNNQQINDIRKQIKTNDKQVEDKIINLFNQTLKEYKENNFNPMVKLLIKDADNNIIINIESDKNIDKAFIEDILYDKNSSETEEKNTQKQKTIHEPSNVLNNPEYDPDNDTIDGYNPNYYYSDLIMIAEEQIDETLEMYFGCCAINLKNGIFYVRFDNMKEETKYMIDEGRFTNEDYELVYDIVGEDLNNAFGEDFNVKYIVTINRDSTTIYKRGNI